jgi:hypothetical protein
MRIAVLFYGRIRKFKEHRENFLDSIGRENILDIFYSADAEPQKDLDEFVDLYKPVRWSNEKIENTIEPQLYNYRNPPSPDHRNFTNVKNMTKHFYNKKRVVGLLDDYIYETGTKYDVVLFLRFDLFYKEPFDLRKTVKQHEGDPFKYEQFSPCCCPSTYTSSQGCLCESLQIRALLGTRGGNRMLDPL